MKNIFVLMVCLLWVPNVWASEVVGKILAVKGEVKAVSSDGSERLSLKLSAPVYENDRIYTGEESKVQIMLNDKSLYTIGENAEVILDKYVYDPSTGKGKSIIEVTKGIFKFLTGEIAKDNPENVKINTPFATIGVRGSGGIVNVEPSGQTVLNMTECCLNIGARGGDKPPVELTQVNTFSRVSSSGGVTPPAPASLDMLMELNNAIDLKDAEKENVKDVTTGKKSKKQAVKKTLKALVKDRSQEGADSNTSDEGNIDEKASTQANTQKKSSEGNRENTPVDSLLTTFGSDTGPEKEGEGSASNLNLPAAALGLNGNVGANITDSQQQKATEDTFGGEGSSELESFGTVQTGSWVTQDAVVSVNTERGAANTVLKSDTNNLIVERLNTDGSLRDRLIFDAPASQGAAVNFVNPEIGNGFIYRGLNDHFYYLSTAFGREDNLGQVVTGQTGVLNSSNQSTQLPVQRLFFDFLPDTVGGKDQFTNFNLAQGVDSPLLGSGFDGKRSHNGGGLVLDYSNDNNQFLGGHVNLSTASLGVEYDYSFKFMVGDIESSGAAALNGSVYSFTNSSLNPAQFENGLITADENQIYGSIDTNSGAAQVDAYGIDISGLNTGDQAIYAVNTGQSDNLSVNATDNQEVLKGFSAGFVTLDATGSPTPVRIGNENYTNVQMVREDFGAAGADIEVRLNLSRIESNGDMSVATPDVFEIGFGGAGADQAYISHNVYGAEEGSTATSYDIRSSYGAFSDNPIDVEGGLLSSYFVDVPNTPDLVETCQDCQYLTWGVWAADIDVSGQVATAQIVPYVVGTETGSWNDITTNGVTNASYKGILVGALSNGSSVMNDVGSYNADIDFANREVSFDGQFAGYHFYDSNVTTGAVATDKGFTQVQLNNLENSSGFDVGHATINGVFYGGNAEEMGGNFNFKDGVVEASGIYAGKKQ